MRGSCAVGRSEHNSWKERNRQPLQNKKLPSRYSISITSLLCFPCLIIYYSTLHLSDGKNLRLTGLFSGPIAERVGGVPSSSNGVKFRTQLGANTGCFRRSSTLQGTNVPQKGDRNSVNLWKRWKRGFFDKTVLFCIFLFVDSLILFAADLQQIRPTWNVFREVPRVIDDDNGMIGRRSGLLGVLGWLNVTRRQVNWCASGYVKLCSVSDQVKRLFDTNVKVSNH